MDQAMVYGIPVDLSVLNLEERDLLSEIGLAGVTVTVRHYQAAVKLLAARVMQLEQKCADLSGSDHQLDSHPAMFGPPPAVPGRCVP